MRELVSAVASHPGLRREENEDAYCAREDIGLMMAGAHESEEASA